MKTLKLLHLMKSPTQLLVACGIVRTVNAGSSVITLVQSHFRIGDLTTIVRHSPERIVNVGKKFCSAAGLNVFHAVAARSGATLVKIPDHTEGLSAHLRRLLRLAFGADRSNH